MSEQVISPLRRRMIEDMAIRKFAPKTQHDYVQRVKEFAAFLGRSPDAAGAEDVRRFQLHLTSSGAGTPKINATVSALRFFFNVTLGRADLARPLANLHHERKAPVILSPEEVARFLDAAPSLKYKAALSVTYGAGLRVSEVVALKVSDVDSKRMMLRVEQGKGSTPREPVSAVRRHIRPLAVLVAGRPRHGSPTPANNQVKTAKYRPAHAENRCPRQRQSHSPLPAAAARTPRRLITGIQIPIAQAAPLQSTARGFLPWRLSDAGRQCTPLVSSRGRHPKPFT